MSCASCGGNVGNVHGGNHGGYKYSNGRPRINKRDICKCKCKCPNMGLYIKNWTATSSFFTNPYPDPYRLVPFYARLGFRH